MRHFQFQLLGASNFAFFVVFGIFIVAFIALLILTLIWVFKRQNTLRKAWEDRGVEDESQTERSHRQNGASGIGDNGTDS